MLIGNFKSSYKKDESIFNEWPNKFGLFLCIIILIFLPLVSSGYIIFLATQVAIFTIAVTGLNILTGYTGLVSLGHGALVGVGAYSTGVLINFFAMPFYLVIPFSVIITATIGIIIGLPSLRIRGLYLTIATLAANFIIIFIIENWSYVTGGDGGLIFTPLNIFGYKLISDIDKYYFIIPIAIISILFAQNLFRTRIGRAFLAIRDADISAEIIGVHLVKYKLYSFCISSAYAGLAGSLWAYHYLAILPTQFELHLSILFLAALVVGGSARVLGPFFGSIFVVLVPELLKSIMGFLVPFNPTIMEYTAPINSVVYGLLIIGFMIFEPMGITAIWVRFWNYIGRWPFSP
ncbi:branched-chain amino acid ABC transporter permease [Alphaproteobacteria bacterium]|nr:branched-chain amino acid ABC transporter permease [Alphaproteobacteria bacterium]